MARVIEVSPSMFAACRCAVVLAWADGMLCENEREVLERYFLYLGFSDAQRAILQEDMHSCKVNFDEEFAKITDPKAKAYFVNISRVLCYADGRLCIKEQAIIDKFVGKKALDAGQPELQAPVTSQAKPLLKSKPPKKSVVKKLNSHDVPLVTPRDITVLQRPTELSRQQFAASRAHSRDIPGLSKEAQKLRRESEKRCHGLINYLSQLFDFD